MSVSIQRNQYFRIILFFLHPFPPALIAQTSFFSAHRLPLWLLLTLPASVRHCDPSYPVSWDRNAPLKSIL